ncbi:hypothetical protein FHR81_000518 [Actinoalloteichus hoggarensis]|nr:hypothetical protein [Actinoalloteichus hoggarensis]MBB5919489.1 hypothetical protein [Actinoalloteichus hoggarensis]
MRIVENDGAEVEGSIPRRARAVGADGTVNGWAGFSSAVVARRRA